MKAPDKQKPDDEFCMSASDFDEAMRKAFGVPPPPKKEPKAVPMRVAKDRPKPTRTK